MSGKHLSRSFLIFAEKRCWIDQVLVTEDKDSEAAKQYANIVAVREGDENREDIKALVEALQSDEVKAYIEETFGSTVIPVF